MSILTGYDSLNVDALPTGGDFYLGYIDGRISAGNYAAVRARFPNARILTVTTTGANRADICDVEPGNIDMAGGVAGFHSGLWRTIYSSRLNPPPAGIPWFAADYTEVPHLVPNSVATQYSSNPDFDTSWALSAWVNPQPIPLPDQEASEMWGYIDGGGMPHVFVANPEGHLIEWQFGVGVNVLDHTAATTAANPTAPPSLFLVAP